MGFWSNEVRAESEVRQKRKAPTRGAIPVHTLAQMGCKACPRDKAPGLRTRRMDPTGSRDPDVVVMWGQPTEKDDATGDYASDEAGRVITAAFRRAEVSVAHLGTVNCAGGEEGPGQVEITCCRSRVVADIEALRPRVVVTVGDEALTWATGLGGSMKFRGSLMPAKIGTHTCWVFVLAFPKFAYKASKKVSPHELALRADIAYIAKLLTSRRLGDPVVVEEGYDRGIEVITGSGTGDMARLEQALHELLDIPSIGVDYETSALRPTHQDDPHIWTAAAGTMDRVVAFPVDHPEGWGTETRMRNVRGLWGEFLMQSGRKIAHNLAFEMEWTEFFYGERPLRLTEWADTQVQSYILDGRPGTNSLGVRTRLFFGFDVKDKSPVDPKRILEYPLPQVLRYNGMDSKWTEGLDREQMAIIAEDPRLLDVHDRRLRLIPSIVMMQSKGLPVDLEYADAYQAELEGKTEAVTAAIRRCPEVQQYSRKFGPFSPSSPDHVLQLMREICRRDEVRKEDWEGNVSYSTDEEVLSTIPGDEVPSAPLILELRGIDKIVGTYLKPLTSGKVVALDGRVHSQYSALRTATSRLAADDPNVQNIPIRSAMGKRVRGAFVALNNGLIVACDYGQIQVRVIGMASRDENLMRYQWTGYDMHGDWGARITKKYPRIKDWIVKTFAVDWDEKGPKTLRQEAKNKWVFPLFFGSRPESCARDLHLPEDVAADLAAEFWDEFPGVLSWQERLIKGYEKNLYVETLDGFRRRGPMTRNEIINTPVQGTEASIVTAAQTALAELAFEVDDEQLNPNLNVHDDLSFWLTGDGMEGRVQTIVTEMCRHRFDFISVPLIVEVKAGKRWNELEPVAEYRSDELFNLRSPFA